MSAIGMSSGPDGHGYAFVLKAGTAVEKGRLGIPGAADGEVLQATGADDAKAFCVFTQTLAVSTADQTVQVELLGDRVLALPLGATGAVAFGDSVASDTDGGIKTAAAATLRIGIALQSEAVTGNTVSVLRMG